MKPVCLAGRGLACSLGLDLTQAVDALARVPPAPARYPVPASLAGHYPYYALPFQAGNGDDRMRQLVQRVAAEAGAEQARRGVLFVANSSMDTGAAERDEQMDFGAFARRLASWLEWQGPVYAVSTACTSSLNALLAAHALLRQEDFEDALVLGVELNTGLTLGGFAALQLLSATCCKPFGAARDGLVLGEAVAALRLSTHTAANWRLAGGANVVDGSQPTSASATAVEAMCARALEASELEPQAIDLIKVQAAGSPGNDAIEVEGMRRVFAPLPALVSLKAAIGHTMAASGAAEIALLTACLERGAWPSYAHETDAGLGVELAAQPPREVRRVLATILGFGGSHAAVVLEREP